MKKQEILDKVDFWRKKMGLENWLIIVHFESYNSSKVDNEGFISIAKTETDPMYHQATMYFKPYELKKVNDSTIVHELLHCVMAEFSGYAEKNNSQKENWVDYFEEKTVSILERIILRVSK